MIELINVNKIYQLNNGETFHAVNNVSMVFNDDEITGIVGYSGAGKSTLVRLLNGLIKPDSGIVTIDGTNINDIDKKELNQLRHNIGMIFQHYNLLSSLTVKENIKLSLKIANYSKDINLMNVRTDEVLELVGLVDKANEYPKNLSGGQKQRVAIARAIANNPKYLLCDEITSALDNKKALEIVELLKTIKEKTNLTVIFISHQLEIVKSLCQRIIVMGKGLIVEDSKTIDLFISPRSDAAKKLIGSIIDLTNYHGKYLLKYKDKANNQTILSDAILKYSININILQAQTMAIGDETIGFLVVDIDTNNKQEVVNYIQSRNVEVELI